MQVLSSNERIIYGSLGSLARLLQSTLYVIIFARAIGPEKFGILALAIHYTLTTNSLLTFGSSNYFYNSFSNSNNLAKSFTVFICLQIFTIFAFYIVLLIAIKLKVIYFIIEDNELNLFLFSSIACCLSTCIFDKLIFFCDARGNNRLPQLIDISRQILLSGSLFYLHFNNKITVHNYLLTYFILTLIFLSFLSFVILKNRSFFLESEIRKKSFNYKDLFTFCKPLVHYEITAYFKSMYDRGLLQIVYGSTEQGHFSFSNRITTIISLLCRPIYNVSWRNSAINYTHGSYPNIQKDLTRTFHLVTWLNCLLILPVIFFSKEVITQTVGKEFLMAKNSLIILSIVTIINSYNNIFINLTYAFNETVKFRNISIGNMVLHSVILTGVFIFNLSETLNFNGSQTIAFVNFLTALLLFYKLSVFHSKVIKIIPNLLFVVVKKLMLFILLLIIQKKLFSHVFMLNINSAGGIVLFYFYWLAIYVLLSYYFQRLFSHEQAIIIKLIDFTKRIFGS